MVTSPSDEPTAPGSLPSNQPSAGHAVTAAAPQPRDLALAAGLVPLPARIEQAATGSFPVSQAHLAAATGADVAALAAGLPGIVFANASPLDPAVDGQFGPGADESYTLTITDTQIVVDAATTAGARYGAATLAQLVREHGGQPGTSAAATGAIPAGVITDSPRYPWRGLSLDIARNFYRLDVLKTVIDLLSEVKLNILHLHATDDQGWRIEVPEYPELTGISGGTSTLAGGGGFLTLADYALVQDYAAAHAVVVVPEIDVPGHTNAALHAIPGLTPQGKTIPDAYTGAEVGFSQLWRDAPETDRFLTTVFASLARATRGPWMHFGGDECLAMAEPDYRALVQAAEQAVSATGKAPIAWQEAAGGGATVATTLQLWDVRHGVPQAFAASVAAGAEVILSPAPQMYLDMMYTADYAHGQDWAGLTDLADTYGWEPATAFADVVAPAQVRGVELTMWTETMSADEPLFEMLSPRLQAGAELAWTPQQLRDIGSFSRRIAALSPRWRAQGVAYYPSAGVAWR